VYDDSVLQQMLSAAQARLVSLQVLEQSIILAWRIIGDFP